MPPEQPHKFLPPAWCALFLYTDASGTLRCGAVHHVGGVPPVDGISTIRLLFAITPNVEGAAPATGLYARRWGVQDDAWPRILAVRVALLVAGARLPGRAAPPRRYLLFGAPSQPYGDGLLRRVFWQTFPMHDRLQRHAP